MAGNRREHAAVEVPRVVTDRLRLVITRASPAAGPDAARIGEIELFGPRGRIAITDIRADATAPGYDPAQLKDGDGSYSEGAGGARGWASPTLPQARTRTLEIALARPAEVGELVLTTAAPEDARLHSWQLLAPRRAVAARLEPPAEPAPARLEPLGDFRPTFYWTTHEEDFPGDADTPLLRPEGGELGRFPAAFVRALKIEGSGRLRDGRVVNVAGKEGTFNVVDVAFGLGVSDYHLFPFRSVAVDRKVVPIGTKLYLPAARGLKLPDGTLHDGVFYAHDVGGAIRGQRIDVFIGHQRHQELWEKGGVKNMKPLPLYRMKD